MWTRADEFGWSLADGSFSIQTTYEITREVQHASNDVIVISRRGEKLLMLRIGSDIDMKMLRFYYCVDGNDKKPLYDMEKCEAPGIGAY